MPDISMCQNKDCPSHVTCYRFLATPNPYRQAYTDFKPEEGETKCANFLLDYESKGVRDLSQKRSARKGLTVY